VERVERWYEIAKKNSKGNKGKCMSSPSLCLYTEGLEEIPRLKDKLLLFLSMGSSLSHSRFIPEG
jgi:hypothetical protein